MIKFKNLCIHIIFLLLLFCNAYSQDSNPKFEKILPNKEVSNLAPTTLVKDSTWGFLSSWEFILSISILLFGLVVIICELYLIKTNQINQEHSIRFIVITLIIISTLYLITAGYNNDQIAPATGLLGTIAGYLLGKSNKIDE